MTRLRDSIRHAQRRTWPIVKASIEAETTPIVIDKMATSRHVRSNIRFVVEETIEALAKAGLLRTPADADVIGKAEEWFGELDSDDDAYEAAEEALVNAVAKLLDEVKDRPGV